MVFVKRAAQMVKHLLLLPKHEELVLFRLVVLWANKVFKEISFLSFEIEAFRMSIKEYYKEHDTEAQMIIKFSFSYIKNFF